MTDQTPAGDPFTAILRYVEAFETLDADRVVPFYRLPCTFMAPGIYVVAADESAARGVAARLIDHAKTAGYARTETRDGEVRRLADDLAQCTGTFVRFDAEGREIGRFGFTYVVCLHAGRWKIAAAVAHNVNPRAEQVTPAP